MGTHKARLEDILVVVNKKMVWTCVGYLVCGSDGWRNKLRIREHMELRKGSEVNR